MVGAPRRRYLATLLRVLVVLLLLLIAFLILGFIVTLMAGPSVQSGNLIGSAAAVAVLWGIIFVLRRFQRMPYRHESRDRDR